MPVEDEQTDLLSQVSDIGLARHLVADLHDDLEGRVARLRQLLAVSESLGTMGAMLFGGETTHAAWLEARSSFVHGNFVATVMLCQGLAEHLLAPFSMLPYSMTTCPSASRSATP